MEKYLYLLINLFTISFPLLRSFEKRIAYIKKWPALFPAILISGTFFIIWDHIFTIMGIWEFNPRYLLGIYLFDLPIEEWFFFITVPFACVFIYEVLNYFFPKDVFRKVTGRLTYFLILFFLVIGIWNLDKWYTSVNFLIAAGMLSIHLILFDQKYLGKFYLTYLVHLFPFLILNGVLTGAFTEEAVVVYNNAENLSLRIFTIPIEDSVYSFTLLLMNITLFEKFSSLKTFHAKRSY
jgi:lycopene cyclase domain-containing protein